MPTNLCVPHILNHSFHQIFSKMGERIHFPSKNVVCLHVRCAVRAIERVFSEPGGRGEPESWLVLSYWFYRMMGETAAHISKRTRADKPMCAPHSKPPTPQDFARIAGPGSFLLIKFLFAEADLSSYPK